MCFQEDRYADAIVAAVRELGDDLILLLSGERVASAAQRHGVRFAAEGYIDLDYREDGTIILEKFKVTRDPNEMAERAVTLAKDGKVPIKSGGWLPLTVQSLCIHGDSENAASVAKAVREGLGQAGVSVASLSGIL